MTRATSLCWRSTVAGLVLTGTAVAQTPQDPDDPTPEPTPSEVPRPEEVTPPVVIETPPPPPAPEPAPYVAPYVAPVADDDDDDWMPLSGLGIAIAAGGGTSGFTNENMRDTADVGGDWDVRLTVGTRSPIAFEGSYIGSAQGLDALGLDNDAVLVSNGLQGAARVNATIDLPVQPFLFAGVGWRRYDVTNSDFNTSNVDEDDNVLEIPMGVGIAGRMRGLVLDLRGEFRASSQENLVPELGEDALELGEDSYAEMHRWGVKATIGYEF